MDSKTHRMYQVIQPGLTTMGVPDRASQVAARILTEAQEMAQAKVDAAQRQLTLAQEEMAGVRALVRAAAGEGATARTDARLKAQLQESKARPEPVTPPVSQCDLMNAHDAHIWQSDNGSSRGYRERQCPGVLPATDRPPCAGSEKCELVSSLCSNGETHPAHDFTVSMDLLRKDRMRHCVGRTNGVSLPKARPEPAPLSEKWGGPPAATTTLTVKTDGLFDEQGRRHATSPSGRHDPALCPICLGTI